MKNDLVTRHVVGSKLNDGNGSESDPLGAPAFSGGSANITGNGEGRTVLKSIIT